VDENWHKNESHEEGCQHLVPKQTPLNFLSACDIFDMGACFSWLVLVAFDEVG